MIRADRARSARALLAWERRAFVRSILAARRFAAVAFALARADFDAAFERSVAALRRTAARLLTPSAAA